MSYRTPSKSWYAYADALNPTEREISAGPELESLAEILPDLNNQSSSSVTWVAAGVIAGGAIGILLQSLFSPSAETQVVRHQRVKAAGRLVVR